MTLSPANVRVGDVFDYKGSEDWVVRKVSSDGVWLANADHPQLPDSPTWPWITANFALTGMHGQWTFRKGLPDRVLLPDGI